jgi:hypothetical protein
MKKHTTSRTRKKPKNNFFIGKSIGCLIYVEALMSVLRTNRLGGSGIEKAAVSGNKR